MYLTITRKDSEGTYLGHSIVNFKDPSLPIFGQEPYVGTLKLICFIFRTYAYINSTIAKMMFWEVPDVMIMASFKLIGMPR